MTSLAIYNEQIEYSSSTHQGDQLKSGAQIGPSKGIPGHTQRYSKRESDG